MGCGASSILRVMIGDVVCSRADRTRTGKVEEYDVSSNPFRVRWDDTGHLSNWLAARDVVALSEDEVCQREAKYGPVLAQREERKEKRTRIGGVGAVVCSLVNRSRTGKLEVYDGSVSPYTVRWDDTDDLSGGLTLEDVDAISNEEKQQREVKYVPIFAKEALCVFVCVCVCVCVICMHYYSGGGAQEGALLWLSALTQRKKENI
jgi:hypothetical protein